MLQYEGYLLVCMQECSSWSFAPGQAEIKAESDRRGLRERNAPVFQLLDKHGVKQHNNHNLAVRQSQIKREH